MNIQADGELTTADVDASIDVSDNPADVVAAVRDLFKKCSKRLTHNMAIDMYTKCDVQGVYVFDRVARLMAFFFAMVQSDSYALAVMISSDRYPPFFQHHVVWPVVMEKIRWCVARDIFPPGSDSERAKEKRTCAVLLALEFGPTTLDNVPFASVEQKSLYYDTLADASPNSRLRPRR
jgi:hypothetical protein